LRRNHFIDNNTPLTFGIPSFPSTVSNNRILIVRNSINSVPSSRISEPGTRFVPQHRYGVNTTVTERTHHFLARHNRSNRTLAQEIEHRRRQNLISLGQPATVDLWYPPCDTTVLQHIANLTTERNSIRDDLIQQEEVQRNFRRFFQFLSFYSIIIIIIIPAILV
jgi:hypothetical protein